MKDKDYWSAVCKQHWHKAAENIDSFNKTAATGYYPPHAYHVDVRVNGVYVCHKDTGMRFPNRNYRPIQGERFSGYER